MLLDPRSVLLGSALVGAAWLDGCLSDDALQIACDGDRDCVGVCVRGVCLAPEAADDGCGSGARWCDGACRDVLDDVDRCGACDTVCEAGPLEVALCIDGGCATACVDDAIDVDGVCTAPCVPSSDGVERCNGADDDCDGATDVDDTDLVTSACGVAGVCAEVARVCVDGVEQCDDAVLATDPAWSAVETRCDGRDNDCDGDTDEGCCPDAAPIELATGPHRILGLALDGDRVRVDALAVEADGALTRVAFEGAAGEVFSSAAPFGPPCPAGQRAVSVAPVDGALGETVAACVVEGAVTLVRVDPDGVPHDLAALDRVPSSIAAAADGARRVIAVEAEDGALVVASDGDGVLARALTTAAIPTDARFAVRRAPQGIVVAAASPAERRLVLIDAELGGQLAVAEVALAVGARPAIAVTDVARVGVVDALGTLRTWTVDRIDERPALTAGASVDGSTIDDVAVVGIRDGREALLATSATAIVAPPLADGGLLDVPLPTDLGRVLDAYAVITDGVIAVVTAGPDGVRQVTLDRDGGRRCDPE